MESSDPIALSGKNLIGATPARDGATTFRATDPSTSQELDPVFHEATENQIDLCLELAEEAFQEYRTIDAERRAAFLDRIADKVEALGDSLLERTHRETALPMARLTGERARTCGQLRMFAKLVREGSWVDARIDLADPKREPVPKPDTRRMLAPLGPVVVFGVSNFPLAFSAAGGDSASALAAGCPVVLKAHPAHPGASELVTRALLEAAGECGLPQGVFSMVHGVSHEVGLRLVTHPLTQAVGFTGSLKAGRALFDAVARRSHPIPFYGEMGSVNPVFVLPGTLEARMDAFVEGYFGSLTLGVGQFCTKPGVVAGLDGKPFENFTVRLGELLRAAPCGTMLHEGIRLNYEEGLKKLSNTEGVRLTALSESEEDRSKTHARAALFEVNAEAFLDKNTLREEVFGPSALAVRCADMEELEAVARAMEGSLTACLHGTEKELAKAGNLISILERKAGRLVFNGFPTGVEVCSSMMHGGPYPATTDPRVTSVGATAIERFARPICYQNFPDSALPVELRNRNERGVWRWVDEGLTKEDIRPKE